MMARVQAWVHGRPHAPMPTPTCELMTPKPCVRPLGTACGRMCLPAVARICLWTHGRMCLLVVVGKGACGGMRSHAFACRRTRSQAFACGHTRSHAVQAQALPYVSMWLRVHAVARSHTRSHMFAHSQGSGIIRSHVGVGTGATGACSFTVTANVISQEDTYLLQLNIKISNYNQR